MNEEYPSPDQKYCLSLGCNEYRMSLWVCSPILRDLENDKILFDAGSLWDAGSIQWSADSQTLSFSMRKYPGSPSYYHQVVIHLDTQRAELTPEEGAMREVAIEDLTKEYCD